MIDPKDPERLAEIKDEMLELLEEAKGILREVGGVIAARAEAYWLPHIRTALDREYSYLGSSMTTMQDTVNELENAVAEMAE